VLKSHGPKKGGESLKTKRRKGKEGRAAKKPSEKGLGGVQLAVATGEKRMTVNAQGPGRARRIDLDRDADDQHRFLDKKKKKRKRGGPVICSGLKTRPNERKQEGSRVSREKRVHVVEGGVSS